ncbi:hypothetical protein [Herpetosiphon giganteus]|uniref:hypothetical protein n=1 Tax=Herpetosiphon giganteus TaxID=2029754 RepID=UPI001957045D|nr:hypothetical protein [Herpetosiphon giganteus]MBM7846295.1 hypothetical protein [Herpetosiphon giganteus]
MKLMKRTNTTGQQERADLANATEQLHRVLVVRWWRWRHGFLAAKRVEIEQRRREG